MNTRQIHERLTEWLSGISMPPLGDEQRRIEEARYDQLRNFLLLLLAACPEEASSSPSKLLERLGPDLTELERYQAKLKLPLVGTPDDIVSVLKLGQPRSELFALQERLMDDLNEDGLRAVVALGKLF